MSSQAGATAAAATAAANGKNPSTFEVFGYLKAMVHGMVVETYLKTEKKFVTGPTTWDVTNSFVQTVAKTLTINCANYNAIADHYVSKRQTAENEYLSGYKMTSPTPRTITAHVNTE